MDPRVAEPQGWGPPPLHGEGGLRDPLKGWTRKDAALADTFSIEQSAVDGTGFGLQFGEVVQAALAAQVVGSLITVSIRSARPSFKYCLMRIETVVNDPTDLGVLRRLVHLPELQAKARDVNRRLLDHEWFFLCPCESSL